MGNSSGLLEEDRWPLILVDRLFLVSPTKKESTGEEVDEVAGGAGGMGVNGIGEVGDRASEAQAAGVYGAGVTAGSMAGK